MQKVKIIIMYTLAFLVLLSIPVYFIAISPSAAHILSESLGIKVNPDLAGGEVMAVFNDEYNDDKGTGTYSYPQAEAYKPFEKHLDLLRYIVKKPVHRGVWSEFKEFWALEVVMGDLANPLNAPAGFSFPVIYIYISVDGMKGGRTDALFPGTNVGFDQAHPWHYCVKVHGWEKDGMLFDTRGKNINKVLIDIIDKQDKLRITIPIEKELNSLTEKSVTWHYVMVGNYDPLEEGNLRPIMRQASLIAGGGNLSPDMAPRIYDYLAPAGESQYKMLSGYNNTEKKSTILKPVKVILGAGLEKKQAVMLLTKDDEMNFERNNIQNIQRSVKPLEKLYEKSQDDTALSTELAALYFQAGDYGRSEALLRKALQGKDADNPAALAYLGALTAKKAAFDKSIMKKMRYMDEAIAMLDKAEASLDYNTPAAIHVLMCRAGVYSAVPENYKKLDSAISDLDRLSASLDDKSFAALKTDALILLGDDYAKKRLAKLALDEYHKALRIAADEYHVKKIKDRIAEAEVLYLENINLNY